MPSKFVLEFEKSVKQEREAMKRLIFGACIILTAFLIALPLSAQTRGGSGGGDGGRGVGDTAGSASASPSVSTSASTSSYSSGASSPSSYGSSHVDTGMGNRGVGVPNVSLPNLQGSSYCNYSSYSHWQDYYSYLYSYYRIYPVYFTRFTRNFEPLMTPAMLRITLRRPMTLSSDMLKAIDELEAMLSDARDGKPVDKKAVLEKSQEIRGYAKQIREDRTLLYVDIRKDTNIVKEDNVDALDPAMIARLREMALDLNRQLTNMYSLSSSSTISVDSYQEPSFASMTKGIEKVCKAIEHSSKRL
jgi:hypothetical protein